MGDEAQFPIKITGDATSLVGASQTATKSLNGVGTAQEQAGKQAEKHNVHLEGMHKLFHSLNGLIPGLGVVMQAAFSPIGATISLAVIAVRLFRDHMAEVNAEFQRLEDEAAKPATNRVGAFRDAVVEAAAGVNRLRQGLEDATRAEKTAKEVTERTSAAFKEQSTTAAALAEAMRDNELARLDQAHAAGLASEEQYAIGRLEIEQRFQDKKRQIEENAEMVEILIRRRAMEQAELRQPELTKAAEAAELRKTKALEDLGSLDKAGLDERRKESAKRLREWMPDWLVSNRGDVAEAFAGIGLNATRGQIAQAAAQTGNFYGPDFQRQFDEWSKRKAAAQGDERAWQQLPAEEARRKVSADIASDAAARSEKAAIDNQSFISGTGQDLGDRRLRFDARRQANQEIGGLQMDTALRQALGNAQQREKSAVDELIKIVAAGHGVTAAQQDQIKQLHRTAADLEKRVREQEGRTPRI